MLPFGRFRVADGSMEPTLRAGDHVLVYRWAYRRTRPRSGVVVRARGCPRTSAPLLESHDGEPEVAAERAHLLGHVVKPADVHLLVRVVPDLFQIGRASCRGRG